ncbi:MAG: hypothetical protein Q8K67_09315 [Geothrix sp.]|nr:hypothetical protein [Geothrix sp.]
MTVRFDDSLPILVDTIAAELGDGAFISGVALRDVTGRLAFFTSTRLDAPTIERLSNHLRKKLGAYARTDRILAGPDDFGVQDALQDSSAISISVGGRYLRLIDRRLAGADWLRTPAPVAPPPPRFVFSSLKGGVGRSTALSVAAVDLASRGRRVLAIDLDMEAPGLGSILLNEGTLPEFGLIDALVEKGLSELDDEFFADLIGPSALADRRGRIDVIPAFGRRSIQNPGDVLAKIARAYTENVRPDGTVGTILDQVREVVDQLAVPSRYDAILVDSRAGLHETTASAILGLGAEVFLFGLDEAQTFQGYLALLAHLARFVKQGSPAPEWLERITMVQGKAPSDSKARADFASKCRALFDDAGLGVHRSAKATEAPLPANPFSDVPWDEDTRDEDLLLDEGSRLYEPLAILHDERFRHFDPIQQRDLISELVYKASYGMFLDRIYQAFPADTEECI